MLACFEGKHGKNYNTIDPRCLLKSLFSDHWFKPRIKKEWLNYDKHLLATVCSTAVANKKLLLLLLLLLYILKSSKFEANLVNSGPCDGFTSFELFSVAYLKLFLARKSVTNSTNLQTNCEAASPTVEVRSSHDHEFLFSWSHFLNPRMKPTVCATA